MEQSDEHWVDAAKEGDPRAMEVLYRRHCNAIHDYALRFSRNRDVAEEVTQETFIRAFRSIKRFQGRSKFRTWLFSIAINRTKTELSKRGRREREQNIDEHEVSVAATDAPGMSRRSLDRALAQLPDGYREVVLMHDVMGLDHAEIAKLRKTSVGTSKSQLHKARAKLRERLTSMGMEATC
ncbi:MAG: sigma-70 family RNA polymerase sigma factor [Myxococcota bacterium]